MSAGEGSNYMMQLTEGRFLYKEVQILGLQHSVGGEGEGEVRKVCATRGRQ